MCMVGIRIKERRNELKLTQVQIREATGISSGNLSEIENGKILPSSTALIQLANTLKCSIDWLLTGESSISENLEIFNKRENELLESFRLLDIYDQEEIVDIINLKVSKLKRALNRVAKSSDLESKDDDSETA